MVLEMAGHGDLLDYVRLRGALAEDKARFMFSQLVSAVQYMHSFGVVHRSVCHTERPVHQRRSLSRRTIGADFPLFFPRQRTNTPSPLLSVPILSFPSLLSHSLSSSPLPALRQQAPWIQLYKGVWGAL